MPTFYDIPEPILHDIISILIDSTLYMGWQLSLRLVNFTFNEAVLYVYYVRKQLGAFSSGTPPEAISYFPWPYYRCSPYFGAQHKYAARFNVQSFLARQNHPPDSTAGRYWHKWKEALAVLRSRERSLQLDLAEDRFYPILSNSSVFKDAASAVLAGAIGTLLQVNIKYIVSTPHPTRIPFEALSTDFWVALSACAIGDQPLLDVAIRNIEQSTGRPSSTNLLKWLIKQQPAFLLTAAIDHAQFHIIEWLLKTYPNITPVWTDGRSFPLRAAIFSNNEIILNTLLNSTHSSPDLAATALRGYHLLNQFDNGGKIVRALIARFSPLPTPLRDELIRQSCAIGDVALLEELLEPGSLLSINQIPRRSGEPRYRPWLWVSIAIFGGHMGALCFLLDNIGDIPLLRHELRWAAQQAIDFNQKECFDEIYRQYQRTTYHPLSLDPEPRFVWFNQLSRMEGSEVMMAEFISQYGLSFDEEDSESKYMSAPYALMNAIKFLRPGNVRFLLQKGAQLPSSFSESEVFDVQWAHFNTNQDAFARVQETLGALGLPKLRIVV